MTKLDSTARISIAQVPMQWTVEDNMGVICHAMAIAAAEGAQVCVFPELAITGFHREIRREAEPARVARAIDRIGVRCAELGIACAVGTPTFCGPDRPRNSHVHLNECGAVAATVHKNGLTPSEATFFDAGGERPVARLHGLTCTSVLCREVEDLAAIEAQVPHGCVDVVFWPSLVGRPPKELPDPEDIDYFPLAQALARQSNAFVIQCNWPNTLNNPEARHVGGSKVFGRDGGLMFALPLDRAGIATFDLGRCDYQWTDLPTEASA